MSSLYRSIASKYPLKLEKQVVAFALRLTTTLLKMQVLFIQELKDAIHPLIGTSNSQLVQAKIN
jgi:hypothetical protein